MIVDRFERALYAISGDSARDLFEVDVWIDATTVKTYSKVYKIESLRSGVTVLRGRDEAVLVPPTCIIKVRELL